MRILKGTAKKLALFLFGWAFASVLIFATLWLLPGDVAQIIGGTTATPAEIAEIRTSLGLNESPAHQYFRWITDFLQADLGKSLVSGLSVSEQLTQKATISLPLVALAFLITLLIALPLGVWSGYRAGKPVADTVTTAWFAAAAAPLVWVALILIAVFSLHLKIFPAQGFPSAGWRDPLAALSALLLPALTVGIVEAAVTFRSVRSTTITALSSDPVRTGMSFGLTRLQSLIRFGMPQASLNLLGVYGVQLATLIVSSVVIERLFALPGIGSMLVTDIGARDIPKVASVLLAITSFILLLGFIIETLQELLDPRIKKSEE